MNPADWCIKHKACRSGGEFAARYKFMHEVWDACDNALWLIFMMSRSSSVERRSIENISLRVAEMIMEKHDVFDKDKCRLIIDDALTVSNVDSNDHRIILDRMTLIISRSIKEPLTNSHESYTVTICYCVFCVSSVSYELTTYENIYDPFVAMVFRILSNPQLNSHIKINSIIKELCPNPFPNPNIDPH